MTDDKKFTITSEQRDAFRNWVVELDKLDKATQENEGEAWLRAILDILDMKPDDDEKIAK